MQDIYEFYNLIGKNIKKVRMAHGDSQEALAEKLDMSRGFLSQLESSVKTGVSLDTLYKLSLLYNVDVRVFFEDFETLKKD